MRVGAGALRAVRAAEGAIDGGDDVGERIGFGDAAGDREGFAAELGDGVGGGFDAGGVAVEEGKVGAGFREGGGPGAADALGESGDDGDAVVEVEEVQWGALEHTVGANRCRSVIDSEFSRYRTRIK